MDRADNGTWDTGEWSVQEPERLGGKQSEGQEGHLGGGLVKPARSGRYKERPSAEPGGAQDTGSMSPANPLPSPVTSSRRRGPSGPGGGAGEDRAGYGERRLARPCCGNWSLWGSPCHRHGTFRAPSHVRGRERASCGSRVPSPGASAPSACRSNRSSPLDHRWFCVSPVLSAAERSSRDSPVSADSSISSLSCVHVFLDLFRGYFNRVHRSNSVRLASQCC